MGCQMYKLYDMETRELITQDEDEILIIDAIGYDMSNNNRLHYMITSNNQGYDFPYKRISSRQDYIDYLNEVKSRFSKKYIKK